MQCEKRIPVWGLMCGQIGEVNVPDHRPDLAEQERRDELLEMLNRSCSRARTKRMDRVTLSIREAEELVRLLGSTA